MTNDPGLTGQSDPRHEWTLFRVGETGPAGDPPPPDLPGWEDLEQRERALGIRPGQPFLLGPGGTPDTDILKYFNSASYRHLALQSQLSYAYDLRVHLSFLASQGIDWHEATEEHLTDYAYWRRLAPGNPRRVGGAKFARELAACRRFYEWAAARGMISHSPVGLVTIRGRDGMVRAIPRLQPSDSQRRRVKWLLPEAYEQWRDVGLAGYTADGEWDESWRGRQDGRNVTFVNTMWSTGLRLREAGSLLLLELPTIPAGRPPDHARVAEAVAKRAGRDFWIPAETLRAIDGYRLSTRAEAVRRAQATGRYEDLSGIMIVSAVTPRRQVVFTDDLGNEGTVPLDALSADDRRRVFIRGQDGLEPAMVWLTEAGMPMDYTSWQTVFRTANARCRAQGLDIHCHPHMLRHSFALRWLAIFIYAFDRRFGLTPQERQEFRKAFGDPYTVVQMLLGHRSSETTRQIYLEPAQGLQIDLFLRDEDNNHISPREVLGWIAATSDQIRGSASS